MTSVSALWTVPAPPALSLRWLAQHLGPQPREQERAPASEDEEECVDRDHHVGDYLRQAVVVHTYKSDHQKTGPSQDRDEHPVVHGHKELHEKVVQAEPETDEAPRQHIGLRCAELWPEQQRGDQATGDTEDHDCAQPEHRYQPGREQQEASWMPPGGDRLDHAWKQHLADA